jgi:nucleoside-diphosphate-sugar epimerase
MEIVNFHNYKLLVVGGTGFIGKHVVKKALLKGFNITVLSKNPCDANNRLKDVRYISADISHKSSLIKKLSNMYFDYVINLGGYINHSKYKRGGSDIYDVHFNGTRNLVDCLDRSILKCFIQVGSSDEYGDNLAPQSEIQRERPISIYSCAKAASTFFLQTLHSTEGFPAVILRPFLVYGPGQGQDRFIPQVINGCINKQNFPTSKGDQLRDFCYIDDFIQAIFLVFENENSFGEVINIASGEPIKVKQVIRKIVDIVGDGSPQFGEINYRSGENMFLYADISKAKSVLNWKPKIDIDEGLQKTYDAIYKMLI